ncbi:MAG: AAA family ATPase [DPANN group archaeon]|nr:AAA family ATPase [DPANN group archaeon]
MKFKKITIKNYKLFNDATITFNDNLTVIVGNNGSGKTILFNLLKNYKNTSKDYSIDIDGTIPTEETYGFISENRLSQTDLLQEFDETNELFMNEIQQLIPQITTDLKSHKKTFNQLKETFAVGEKILFDFAKIFTLRQINNTQFPIVLDSLFSILSKDKSELLLKRLLNLNEQVIIIENEHSLPDGLSMNYKLNYKDEKTNIEQIHN